MQILDLQQRQEEQELRMMQEDLGRHNGNSNTNGGHQSEPTTPPEYSSHRETSSGFPTVLSRPNRYSTSSLMSPVGQLYNRPGRSASTLTPGQFGLLPSRFTMDENVIMKSGSGSRRGSDEEDDKDFAVRQDPSSHRSSDRYVMRISLCRHSQTPIYCHYLPPCEDKLAEPVEYCGSQCFRRRRKTRL